MKERNLLNETESAFKRNGYEWDNVQFIQNKQGVIPVESFKKLANHDYDPGYGTSEVRYDLVIVMDDGSWFTRGEYDGSEWWEFHKIPEMTPRAEDSGVMLDSVFEDYWIERHAEE